MKDTILIPIRCYTCSRVIAINSIIKLIEMEVEKDQDIKPILVENNYSYCCRIHFITKYVNHE